MTTDVMTKKEVLGVYQPGSAHMVGDGFPRAQSLSQQ